MEPPQSEGQENRILAALGYPIWIVALIVLLTDMKRQPFMRRHAVQGLGLAIALLVVEIALGIIGVLPGLWFIAWQLRRLAGLVFFIAALVYAYRAYQGKVFSVPVVSDVASRYLAAA